MNIITDKFDEWRSGGADKQFGQMVDQLTGFDKFDMNEFLLTLEDATKMAGIKGLKTKMPWASNDPMAQELMRFIKIVEMMSPEERAQPNKIKPPQKKRIAVAAEAEISEVNTVITRWGHSYMMWETLKELKDSGKAMPKDIDEAQSILMSSPKGRARAQNSQIKAMKKRYKKTGKMNA